MQFQPTLRGTLRIRRKAEVVGTFGPEGGKQILRLSDWKTAFRGSKRQDFRAVYEGEQGTRLAQFQRRRMCS